MKDSVLVAWLVTQLVWDVFIWAGCSYVVFWRGRSGWWFLLAIAATYSEVLIKVLRKRYGIPGAE